MRNRVLSSVILLFVFLSASSFHNDSTLAKSGNAPSPGAYNYLKKNELPLFIETMEQHGFLLAQFTQEETSPGTRIDTLVFQNNDENHWAFFRIVDLEYIRVINGFILYESDQNTILPDGLFNIDQENSPAVYKTNSQEQVTIEIRDHTETIVIDRRWKTPTETLFNSLYAYVITMENGFVHYQIEEVVPAEYEICGVLGQ